MGGTVPPGAGPAVEARSGALLTGDGRFAGHFEEVVFAVLDRSAGTPTLAAFRKVLAHPL
ncbi:hypothetical protein [Streptomyces globisporus]|uniref:hypothetical protein n=1 Tax=Streptomyces globisporus TaxID=1908 RepID=UPI0004C4E5D7